MSKRFKDELPTLAQPYNEDKLRLTDHHTLKPPLPLLTTRWTSTIIKCFEMPTVQLLILCTRLDPNTLLNWNKYTQSTNIATVTSVHLSNKQNGTKCRDYAKLMLCCSYNNWLLFGDSIPKGTCFASCEHRVTLTCAGLLQQQGAWDSCYQCSLLWHWILLPAGLSRQNDCLV